MHDTKEAEWFPKIQNHGKEILAERKRKMEWERVPTLLTIAAITVLMWGLFINKIIAESVGHCLWACSL